MKPQRWQVVKEVLAGALQCPPEERSAYLNNACKDRDLRHEVESLIAAQGTEGAKLDGLGNLGIEETLEIGSKLGPYSILACLGAGGMGVVYRARDERLERDVAIKVLPPGVLGSEGARRRFRTEAVALARLNHPNIATIYEVGEDAGQVYIAMELVEGRPLNTLVKPNGLPLDAVIRYGLQICAALAHAHDRGLVHRDLKPENVVITKDGHAKLLDFGLARRLPSADLADSTLTRASLTQTGALVGTLRYMAPETLRGESADACADLWALGVVLYEMATGVPPFSGLTTAAIIDGILHAEPVPARKRNPQLPVRFDTLLNKLFQKDPSLRCQTTADLQTELERLRRDSETTRQSVASTAAAVSTSGEQPVFGKFILPIERTPFVGRQKELASIRTLLQNPALRLLTLTGPGGSGKTRLALEAARDNGSAFPGGVCFAELAPLTETRFVISAVAKAANVRERPSRDLLDLVRERFSADESVLLILDNFERLLDAAPVVGDWLKSCPNLKVLVTSRVPLRVYGEQEFPVLPLPLPAASLSLSADQLTGFASVELFVQRASAVRPDFLLTEENAATVVEICRRLDGLPLAIELAAARVKLLPPGSLLARIESRLEFLTGGPRDLPERQQTLRRTIDWSYELLTPAERTLFRRLSVFAGGCTLEATEAVANTREDLGLDVFDGVASLVDKSLLQQEAEDAVEPRFSMLETIREYALERLQESGERPATEQAHAAYYILLAEEEIGRLPAEQLDAWLRRSAVEHENFRVAVRSLLSAGNTEWALRLGAALQWFWEYHEYYTEGLETLSAILRMPGARERTALWARAAYSAGILSYRLWDTQSSIQWHSEALAIFRRLNDRQCIATSLNALAMNARRANRLQEGRAMIEEAVELWREAGDDDTADHALSNAALIAKDQGDYDGARAIFEQLAHRFRARGDLAGGASIMSCLGDVAAAQKNAALARSNYEVSVAMFRRLNDHASVARVLADLGNLTRDGSDYEAARAFYLESLKESTVVGRRTSIAQTLADFAWCEVCQERYMRAAKLAASAESLWKSVGTEANRKAIQKVFEATKSRLPEGEHTRTWAEGQRFDWEHAIQYAFGQSD